MSDRDYSGVAMKELASLIRAHVPEGEVEEWATRVGFGSRSIRHILDESYSFQGLNVADKICLSLGLNVSDTLTIVPAASRHSARKMAMDEFEAKAEVLGIDPPSEEEMEVRIAELQRLREELIGAPTQEQFDRLQRDAERTKKRNERKRLQRYLDT